MGNSAATPQLTQEQEDIKYLGSRYPFGDDELLKLIRVHSVVQRSADKNVSFLSDWATHCVRLKPADENLENANDILQNMKAERRAMIQVVEQKILPPDFSERLNETNFGANTKQSLSNQFSDGNETDAIRMARMQQERRIRLENFFDGLSKLGRKGGRHAIGVLFKYFEVEKGPEHNPKHMASFHSVLDLAYRLSLAAAFLKALKNDEDMAQWVPPEQIDEQAIKGLCQSVVDYIKRKRIRESPYGTAAEDPDLDAGFVEKLDLQEWAETNAPVLSSSLGVFMFHIFFPERQFPQSRTSFDYPNLLEESTFFRHPTDPLLFSFACLSTSLGGSWHRLFTSSHDGLSFNRLQNSLLGYSGPTLLVIRENEGGIFGAFTASPWKESKDFYGNSDCFLYQLLPMTAVYRPTGNEKNFMYCNSEARSRGYDGQAHGIGFGGSVDEPRLLITESFEGCVARSQDLSFEYGLMLPKTADGGLRKTFDIDSLEVWGVGGDEMVAEALSARDRQRSITAANIRKARKVDKAAFLDDFRSGVIESKAFAHRDQMRGRADAAIDDKHSNAYVYEK